MLTKFFTLAVAGMFLVTICRANDAGQILDVGIARNGNIEDDSKERRSLEVQGVTVARDKKSAALGKINAIVIPYKEKDPLYQNGPQTWLFRIKIPDPMAAPSVCLAGRWNAGENRRSIGLLMLANEGVMQFLVSSDGGGETTAGIATKETLPAGDWFTLVVKFQPETRMEILVFDDSGFQIGRREMTSGVPVSFFEDDLPFWIGAPAEIGLEFSRFAVWKRILSDSQIGVELKKSP
jgi:hypothetical protein